MKKLKFTDGHIFVVLKQAEAETAVPMLSRDHCISTAAFLNRILNSAAWKRR